MLGVDDYYMKDSHGRGSHRMLLLSDSSLDRKTRKQANGDCACIILGKVWEASQGEATYHFGHQALRTLIPLCSSDSVQESS